MTSAALVCWPVTSAFSQARSADVQLDAIDVQGTAAPAVDTPPGTTGYVATQATAAAIYRFQTATAPSPHLRSQNTCRPLSKIL